MLGPYWRDIKLNLKGIVSSLDGDGVRVTFPCKDNNVSYIVKVAKHMGELKIGDMVAVAFFSKNMIDGIIIAQY